MNFGTLVGSLVGSLVGTLMPGEVEPGGRGTFSDLEALPRLQEGSPGTENTTGLGRNLMGLKA